MPTQRQLFFRHIAQTSPEPPAFEFSKAEGVYLYDHLGSSWFDLISGIAVSSLGHGNTSVKKAIHEQTEQHLHLMVYGEFVIGAQVALATLLADLLPSTLSSVYFTNSGSEAVEGAMKLAKRFTGRHEFISFRNSYHGSTQGALSLSGSEFLKNGYYPLLPGCAHIDYNSFEQLNAISEKTAAVIMEPVQAEAGVILPEGNFLQAVRKRCDETGALLIMDEIQTGMGRTGKWFAFNEDSRPDILLLGKSFGAGMPLAAFISSTEIMSVLTYDPVLGHITTFGGHPLSCAAAKAGIEFLIKEELIDQVKEKEQLFLKELAHPLFKSIRSAGLLMAIELESEMINRRFIQACYESKLVTDWFLFAPHCTRLAPPLTITKDEIKMVCHLLKEAAHRV